MSEVEEDAVLSDADWQEESHQDGVQEDEKTQVCHLTQDTISQGLSLLCRTGNGLAHAFVKLDLKDKGLTDIAAISSYVHLRFLDISNNRLTDLSPLASLNQLLWLKVDHNAVTCFKGQPIDQLPYLQWLSMASNQLTEFDGPIGHALESLNLTGNSIKRMKGLQSGCFANLVTLELRGNHLETTDGIYLPNLQRLYLAQNTISRLEGLERLERLTVLHLRDNKLDSLDGLTPNMKCLHYLNVRGNGILDEKALQHLRFVAITLRTLVLSENPLVETADYRLSILILVPQLERIDKDLVSIKERTEAWTRIRELNEEEIPDPEDL